MALGHRHTTDDRVDAGWNINETDFERFSQVFDAFNRSGWDDTVRSEKSDALRDYDSFGGRLWARLAGGRFRRLALKWDQRSGRGERVSPKNWWELDPSETSVELTKKPT